MNSNTFTFDSHFAIAVTDEVHPSKIWNRELLTPQDEVPNPLKKEMKGQASQLFQLSTGWMITRYTSRTDDGIYTYYPGSKKAPPTFVGGRDAPKKLKPQGYINSVTEFPNGDILIFAKQKAFGDPTPYYIFIYTKSFSFIKKVEVPYTYSTLALNSETLIIATINRLNLYTYPEFHNKKYVRLPGLLYVIRDLKRITDFLFISCDDRHFVKLWNENLELLKIFEFHERESIRKVYILPTLTGKEELYNTRILALSWNIGEEEVKGKLDYFPKAGITIFPLGKFPLPRNVNMSVTIRVPNIIGGDINSMIYIQETQEVLTPTRNGITSTSLETFKTKILMHLPREFVQLISIRWPPSKEEFESVVKKMKKLIPIPVDLIRETLEFLKL